MHSCMFMLFCTARQPASCRNGSSQQPALVLKTRMSWWGIGALQAQCQSYTSGLQAKSVDTQQLRCGVHVRSPNCSVSTRAVIFIVPMPFTQQLAWQGCQCIVCTSAHLYTKYIGTSSAYSTYRSKPKPSSKTKGRVPHLLLSTSVHTWLLQLR